MHKASLNHLRISPPFAVSDPPSLLLPPLLSGHEFFKKAKSSTLEMSSEAAPDPKQGKERAFTRQKVREFQIKKRRRGGESEEQRLPIQETE